MGYRKKGQDVATAIAKFTGLFLPETVSYGAAGVGQEEEHQ